MLAADAITIELDGEVIPLRPTLRAAIRLERNFGLPKVLADLQAGSYTMVANIVGEGSGSACVAGHQMSRIAGPGLGSRLQAIIGPCLAFLVQLYGLDEEAAGEPDPSAPLITYSAHFAHLYRVATGWLGWSAATALDTSPAEIMAAAQGRRELISDILRAVFGAPAEAEPVFDETRDPDATAKLKGLAGRLGTHNRSS
jgi:hypothetical protein